MTNILLNGIPRIGKTGIIENLKRLSKTRLNKEMKNISLGDIVAKAAHEVFRIEKERIPYLDYSFLQMTLRPGAISKARLEMRDAGGRDDLLVDTPLTMYTQVGVVPEVIFSQEQIQRLHNEGPFDFVVSLIDEPSYVIERLVDTPYPRGVDEILDWLTLEAQLGRSFAPYDYIEETRVPHYVFPVENAAANLLRLLYDIDPTVVYSMGPITHMKARDFDPGGDVSRDEWEKIEANKKQGREKLNQFRDELHDYAAVVVPLTMADASRGQKAIANTIFRDLHFFVPQSKLLIAYYPDDYHSSGVAEEMRHGLRIGKPVILIHPKGDDEVFGIRPTLKFRTKEEFFDILQNYKSLILERPELRVLRPLLDDEFNPRYARLR